MKAIEIIASLTESMAVVDEYDEGYGRLAAFEDCDPNFLIYRKYGWLHNRLLLHLQDELKKLEEDLERLDKWESTRGDDKKLRSRRRDSSSPTSKRQALITTLNEKLKDYGMPKLHEGMDLQLTLA